MTDREKVIKGLSICSSGDLHSQRGRDCTNCPYYPAGWTGCTAKPLLLDALELLKKQETVKPEFDSLDGYVGKWRCGNCHVSIGAPLASYCWHCGKAMKWE